MLGTILIGFLEVVLSCAGDPPEGCRYVSGVTDCPELPGAEPAPKSICKNC